MIPLISQHPDELAELCRWHHVERLEVFGSATAGNFNPDTSDIDFLVEFNEPVAGRRFETHFELTESLESLFGRPVDLIVYSNVENPYFRASVDQTQKPIFEAQSENPVVGHKTGGTPHNRSHLRHLI